MMVCGPLLFAGGHSHWKGVLEWAAFLAPFFQASGRSLAYQFTVNVPLLCPLFSIFRNILHFQPCFGQNSSSRDPNFSTFLFPRPPFFKENLLPRPYFETHVAHIPLKVECPPGLFAPLWTSVCIETHTCRAIVFIWPSNIYLWPVFGPVWPARRNNTELLT